MAFAEKLDGDVRQYRILGASNPPLAHEGQTEGIELVAPLPCNVVYEAEDGAVDPAALVGIADDPALGSIGTEVRDRFERVLAAVGDEANGR